MALFSIIKVAGHSTVEKVKLIHVKISTQPDFSKAKQGEKVYDKHLIKLPEIEVSKINADQKQTELSLQQLAVSPQNSQGIPLVSSVNHISIIKEKFFVEVAPSSTVQRNTQASLLSAQEILKESVVSSGGNFNSLSSKLATSDYKVSIEKSKGYQGSSFSSIMIHEFQGHDPKVSFENSSNSTDIKSFLGYTLLRYEDPLDHAKYFKLSIRVGEIPGTLPAIPKEIIFLMDASNSIGSDILKEFKKGIVTCLSQLSAEDKFNILVFRNTVIKMSEVPLSNNAIDIQKAMNFLGNIKVGLDTDIFDAVLKSINLENIIKPTYIYLLSDGQPTAGVKNPLQVINQIAEINKGRTSIFALGSGTFLDRYFINFLAFTNRGWGEFSPNDPQKGILKMYNHIKNPVLLDLRSYVSGLNKKEIYPKVLPDLFKGSEFVLYGLYTNEKSFYLQLFGDARDGTKQYLITDDVSLAPKGDRKIAQEWAIRKIYHLIGLLEHKKNNQALIAEIKALATKFKLTIPSIDNLK